MTQTVRDYFERLFPQPAYETTAQVSALDSIPLNTPCGLDCKMAIDAAALVEDNITKAHGPVGYDIAHPDAALFRSQLEFMTLGLILVFICG